MTHSDVGNGKSPQPLVLLTGETSLEGCRGVVVHWDRVEVPEGHISLPNYVATNADSLKSKYLEWVHQLGQAKFHERTVVENLRLDESGSFWWMNFIAEKSPMRSDNIQKVLRLMALEAVYEGNAAKGLTLVGGDKTLRRVLKNWLQRLGHPYRRINAKGWAPPTRARRYGWLPLPLQAGAYLVKYWWSSRLARKLGKQLPPATANLCVVSYFTGEEYDCQQPSTVKSPYWQKLAVELQDSGKPVTWAWLRTSFTKKPIAATTEALRRANASDESQSVHTFVDGFLTLKSTWKIVSYYLRVQKARARLSRIKSAFAISGSRLNFWPIMSGQYKRSLSGTSAMQICILRQAFRALRAKLPRSGAIIVYPAENQPWERALSQAFRGSENRLIGFQHAMVGPLNMRSFEHPSAYTLSDGPPLPDVLAVNGEGARKMMLEAGFPASKLAVVEALRYMYLQGMPSRKAPGPTETSGTAKTLLVVTGYLPSETRDQLAILARAAQLGSLKQFKRILIKPHPTCPVDGILAEVAPELPVELAEGKLADFWPLAGAVFAANSTSAALEAAWLGLPLVVAVPADGLDLSPVHGLPGVRAVSTGQALAAALYDPAPCALSEDFFCMDPSLKRWRTLLKLNQGTKSQ